MSMKLGYDLTIEQTQKLVMTPELIQAISKLRRAKEEYGKAEIYQAEADLKKEIADIQVLIDRIHRIEALVQFELALFAPNYHDEPFPDLKPNNPSYPGFLATKAHQHVKHHSCNGLLLRECVQLLPIHTCQIWLWIMVINSTTKQFEYCLYIHLF